jgi:hypothetical protein
LCPRNGGEARAVQEYGKGGIFLAGLVKTSWTKIRKFGRKIKPQMVIR